MSSPVSPPPAPGASSSGASPQALVERRRVGTRLRLTITFPVRTRLRRQRSDGRSEAAYFVQSFSVERDGIAVASGHLGPYMAEVPLVECDVEAPLPSEAWLLTWVDSRGARFEQPIRFG